MPIPFTGGKSLGPNLNRYTDTPEHELGMCVESLGNEYRYVRFVDNVAYAPGHVVTLAGTNWEVTNRRSGGSDISLIPVGVCTGSPSQNQYGWVQTTGIADVLCTGTGIVAGDVLVPSPTVNGAAAENTYGSVTHDTLCILGVALQAISSGSTGKVLLLLASC